MFKCNYCNKGLKSSQGLQGHIRLVHQNNNADNVNEVKSVEYPFNTSLHLTSEALEFARLLVLCGFANSPEELFQKTLTMQKLLIYHDPEFLVYLRDVGIKTAQDIVKLCWFMQQVGLVTGMEDLAKKIRAYGVLKEINS